MIELAKNENHVNVVGIGKKLGHYSALLKRVQERNSQILELQNYLTWLERRCDELEMVIINYQNCGLLSLKQVRKLHNKSKGLSNERKT